MENLEAIWIVEGLEEASTERYLEAWQHLVSNGLAWQLQGWFGRQAEQLIEAGLIVPPGEVVAE